LHLFSELSLIPLKTTTMLEQYISSRNLKFVLYELLNVTQLQQIERFEAYDREAIDMTLEAAKQIGDQYLFPFYRAMDKDKAYYANGEVHVHPCMKPAIEAMAEGGWINAHDDFEVGGQQMPYTVLNAATLIFHAANANITCHPFLTTGAANLIRTFGSEALNEAYIPQLYSGKWQGTMALTEPQAGSSLSDITSSAEPVNDGEYYKIKGQKIYISGGDHNAVDNVVHLLLARIKGAPVGTKGISLFVVPKFREEAGQLVSNDVTTAGIYGKMGQKGYVAAHLMMGEQHDDCRGYLVGEPHQGLRYMFQMMNEARIGTGMVAAASASAAYYASLKYANERPQGRHPSNKDVHQPQVLIIEHADVRRMLLYQKAIVEGSIALLLQCSLYGDLAHRGQGEAASNAHLLLELLTPIAKSYPSEMGIHSVSQGMQVLGGAGYTDDFPLEQLYRDIRVNAIYEGTTTIHGMDLLGRKLTMSNGKGLQLLSKEIQTEIEAAMEFPNLKPYAEQLMKTGASLQETTVNLFQLAQKESPEVFLADATLYLEYFGTLVLAWLWLKQAIAAEKGLTQNPATADQHFYAGKLQAFKYFFEYELPKTVAMKIRLNSSVRVTMETSAEMLV
jgi:alkylation response protein AidB-like acyl-CoA dehydrogenase